MSGPERRLARFVEDILRNRRPRRFRASPDELGAMRAAAELRAARPGADLPEDGAETRRRPVSRRRLLLGAGGAAAAAVAGAAVGVVGDRLAAGGAGTRELIPAGATWQPVMAATAVANGRAVRFSTGAVEGFVVNRGGHYQAVSAVCTHLGCILQQGGTGRLTCPCHRTAFWLDGTVAFHQLPSSPGPLPLLRTRIREGQVEVLTT